MFKRKAEEIEINEQNAKKQKVTLPTCGICFCEEQHIIISCCNHIFCVQCYISNTTTALPNPYEQNCHVCPTCRADWNKPNEAKLMEKGASLSECESFIDTRRKEAAPREIIEILSDSDEDDSDEDDSDEDNRTHCGYDSDNGFIVSDDELDDESCSESESDEEEDEYDSDFENEIEDELPSYETCEGPPIQLPATRSGRVRFQTQRMADFMIPFAEAMGYE